MLGALSHGHLSLGLRLEVSDTEGESGILLIHDGEHFARNVLLQLISVLRILLENGGALIDGLGLALNTQEKQTKEMGQNREQTETRTY